MSSRAKESPSRSPQCDHAATIIPNRVLPQTATDGPYVSPTPEIPLFVAILHLPLLLATVVIGGVATTLFLLPGVRIITHGPLEAIISHLFYAGLMMCVATFSITAACSYMMPLVGRDLHHRAAMIWLPLVPLMITTVAVILAAQLWYINHHSHPGSASVVMALTFLAIALVPIMFIDIEGLPDRWPKTWETRPHKE